jgi:hypothetical protein
MEKLEGLREKAIARTAEFNAVAEGESRNYTRMLESLNQEIDKYDPGSIPEEIAQKYRDARDAILAMSEAQKLSLNRGAQDYQAALAAESEILRSALLEKNAQTKAASEKEETRKRKELADMNAKPISDERKRENVEAFNKWLVASQNKLAFDLEGPMAKLAQQWADVTGNMKDATTDWAKQGMDMFITFAETGKLNFSSLVNSILKDILRIQMQKTLGPAMNALMSFGTQFVTGLFTSGASIGAPSPTDMRGGSFADGGIMTQFGKAPLRKYAMGGIAKSPQVALFGEGSYNEAYVPLPDGRSIPVTMKGGSMPNVIVNVINQSGQEVNATQGQPKFDAGQMVLDVVLSAANRPGPFRDGMRGAVR